MRSSFAVLVTMLVAGCVVETAPATPPPPPPVARPAPKPRPAVAVRPAPPPRPRLAAIEAGYEHCCGNGAYRLEIGCGYLDLRCYQRTATGWVRTFGRHCKEQLGMACYLNGCDDLCSQ